MKLKRSVNIFINSFLFYDTFVYNVSGYMIWTLQIYCFYFIHQRKTKFFFKKNMEIKIPCYQLNNRVFYLCSFFFSYYQFTI